MTARTALRVAKVGFAVLVVLFSWDLLQVPEDAGAHDAVVPPGVHGRP